MQSQEQIRLKYCNSCINKKVDTRFGVLCGLTDQKPNFKYTCKDFKKGKPITDLKSKNQTKSPPFSNNTPKTTTYKKSKSPFWVGGSVLFTVIIIIFKIARSVSSFSSNSSVPSQYEVDYLKTLENARINRSKVPTINYLSANNTKATFSRKMETDTVIILNPKVKLKLPRRFRLSIYNEDSELPIKATSSGYYFICNKIKVYKNQKQLLQWEAYRNQLISKYPGSQLIIKKPLTINTITNDLDRIDFEIKNSVQTIIGTARIVDYNNDRYFFQLVSDASNADHTITNKYLRYYVKVK